MKRFLTIFMLGITGVAFAQPKIYQQATIQTTTEIIAPEEEDLQNLQGRGDGGMNFRNMMDGEFKFTTYVKNEMMKMVIKSEMIYATIYRDNQKKLTTSIMEMMGSKNGFYITDQEQVEMQKMRDSMMAERRKKDTTMRQFTPPDRNNNLPVELSVTAETKKIAGYVCKKAYLITTRLLGNKDTVTVWYSPDFKIENISTTGGMSALPMMGNMIPQINGLDKIDGFVMRYEMKMRRNRQLKSEITKIDLEKAVSEKEFELPKDVEIKPMKEMQNMFGGGRGMMRGGRD